ncbi:hypothetical protein [Ruminococcus sp.]|uniref:hypothetical protein n=1 Tax=Ruminococcus sp. TaxID=41978 RepID=UPI0025D3E34E|nr:hypothetical protein [Ruminococcus sp.]
MDNTETLSGLREELVLEIHTLLENFEHIDENSESYKPIYAKINQIEFRNNKFYLSGDLLTDKLIKFDSQYFNDNEFHQGIKPVYFGFETTISLESVWHRANQVTKFIFKNLSETEVDFSNYYELIDKLDELQEFNELENVFSTKKYNLFNTLFSIKYDKHYYRASIFFSASPFQLYEKGIRFDQIKDNSYLVHAHYSRIKELQNTDISNTLLHFRPSILREYNVGQGNFSELIDDHNQKIVFDAGFTYLDKHDNFSGARQELQDLEAECYFISHFDLDHILGTIYLKDSEFLKNKLWIIPKPNIANTSPNADRLIWYLYNNAKLRMIEDSTHSNIFVFNPSISIYKGKAKTTRQEHSSLYANCSGIMISAKGNNKTALLPGDCLYNYWSSQILNSSGSLKYDCLIVPHHGCKIKQLANIKIIGNQNATAIVPVGKKQNDYHHPDYNHIKELDNNGFSTIYLTVDLRNSININAVKPVKYGKSDECITLKYYPDKSPQDYLNFSLI